jgi:hypothetical protein
MADLKPCPFCGGEAEVKDYRVGFAVECTGCKVHVYGTSMAHLDHIGNDEESEAAFAKVDWNTVKQTAIDAWNRRQANG